MPLILGHPYETTWGGYPPHMSRDDYILWLRTKDDLLKGANAVYYDVGLGGDFKNQQTDALSLQQDWGRLTQKRLDVLIDKGQEWLIVELRHQSTGSEIGRLLIYRDMFEAEKPDDRPVSVILITGRYDAIVENIAKKQGIQYQYVRL